MAADSESKDHTYSRKQKSLVLLCSNFLRLYNRDGVESVGLDDSATKLGVERQRIYDIVNVLESVGELEALQDPMRKEVAFVRKRLDTVNKELRPLGLACHKKEKEYKETIEAFNERNKEKAQLVAKLVELVTESEKLRFKKLEELSKHIESLP